MGATLHFPGLDAETRARLEARGIDPERSYALFLARVRDGTFRFERRRSFSGFRDELPESEPVIPLEARGDCPAVIPMAVVIP